MAKELPAYLLDVFEGEVLDVDGASPDVVEQDFLVCFSPLLYLRRIRRHWGGGDGGGGLVMEWLVVLCCVYARLWCEVVWRVACGVDAV